MPIWSIDAQPKGYRLLTGGGDNKVKIWNILPIISAKHELNLDTDEDVKEEKVHIDYLESLFDNEETKSQRLLATLTAHSSPINCVRWNHQGTMFASASDDGTIYLWEYHGVKRGAYENKDQVQENWVSIKYLRGHKDSKRG